MATLTRRNFLKLTGMAAVVSISNTAMAQKKAAHVVVIGGGFGGATCAKYLKLWQPGLKVTLIEPDKKFLTCPFSNYVLAGFRTMQTLTQNYGGLRKHGVQVIHDRATAIDPAARKVSLKNGKS